MRSACRLCGGDLGRGEQCPAGAVTAGICPSCLAAAGNPAGLKALLEAIDAPVLLMQADPRQVVMANAQAQELFAKAPAQIDGQRGGQVFDCLHSFTAAGCGKDINCEHCAIKGAIVDTFATTTAHRGVAATLPVKKAGALGHRALQVSTEKIGDLALVRIERYDAAADRAPPAST